MKKISVSLCLLTATLFAVPAIAQEGPPPDGPGSRGPRQERMLEKFDTNHDGQLDESERAAAREKWKKQHPRAAKKILQRFDKDGDGKLNEDERAEARKARQEMRAKAKERRQEVLARFDRDGNGKLGEDERKAFREAWHKFIQQQPIQKPAAN